MGLFYVDTLAMTIALTIMQNTTIAMPSTIYSIFMYIFAGIFDFLMALHTQQEQNVTL